MNSRDRRHNSDNMPYQATNSYLFLDRLKVLSLAASSDRLDLRLLRILGRLPRDDLLLQRSESLADQFVPDQSHL